MRIKSRQSRRAFIATGLASGLTLVAAAPLRSQGVQDKARDRGLFQANREVAEYDTLVCDVSYVHRV